MREAIHHPESVNLPPLFGRQVALSVTDARSNDDTDDVIRFNHTHARTHARAHTGP